MNRNIRARVLKRDNFRCISCGGIENLDVHHLFPKSYGGEDRLENLITLCAECHPHWEAVIREYVHKLVNRRITSNKLWQEILLRSVRLFLYLFLKREKNELASILVRKGRKLVFSDLRRLRLEDV